MTVTEKIGVPALMEQTAEECSELTQACLKFARFMRDENPVGKSETSLMNDLVEEVADVILCLSKVVEETNLISNEAVDSMIIFKDERWRLRLGIGVKNNGRSKKVEM